MNQRILDHEVEYVVAQLKAGKAVCIDTDERDDRITGIVGVESHTPFSLWVADRAERRASTHNS